MSVELSSLPEVNRLVDALDNALALERQMGRGSDASRAVEGLFRDLGRTVHRAMKNRTRPPTSDWDDFEDDLDDEPTVIDMPDEDEDAGIVTRNRALR